MKVFHVIKASYVFGGADCAVLLEVESLRRLGVDARVVALEETRPEKAGDRLIREARRLGLPLHRIAVPGRLSLSALGELSRLFATERPDLVHPHVSKAAFYCLLAAAPLRIPLVGEIHGWTLERADLRHLPLVSRGYDVLQYAYIRIEPFLLRQMARVMVLTREHLALAERLGIPRRKLCYAPRGHDLRRLEEGRGQVDWRARLGVPGEQLLIGAAGRLAHEKAQHLLVEAVARLRDRFPVAGVLAGDGDLEAPLRARAAELGVADRFHFPGFVEEVPDFLSALDVFVLTSVREGLSRTLIEAMALGRPCVASAVGGNRELLTDGETGLLFPSGDLEALTACLARLLDDASLRERLGARARQHAREHLDIAGWAAGAVEIYRQVADEERRERTFLRRLRGSPW